MNISTIVEGVGYEVIDSGVGPQVLEVSATEAKEERKTATLYAFLNPITPLDRTKGKFRNKKRSQRVKRKHSRQGR